MFPGMRMPDPVPEHVMYPRVWKALNRFILVSVTTTLVAIAIRHCESKVLLKDIM